MQLVQIFPIAAGGAGLDPGLKWGVLAATLQVKRGVQGGVYI